MLTYRKPVHCPVSNNPVIFMCDGYIKSHEFSFFLVFFPLVSFRLTKSWRNVHTHTHMLTPPNRCVDVRYVVKSANIMSKASEQAKEQEQATTESSNISKGDGITAYWLFIISFFFFLVFGSFDVGFSFFSRSHEFCSCTLNP